MTISQYLERKRQENPELANLSALDLYNKLEIENPQELANLTPDTVQTTPRRRTGQKAYERKADPNFVNSLFDWTDWGINEGSSQWAKAAYNHSITGLAYQYYNGEQRFNLDGYNPGMAEDIFSAVLSFMMPMDFASMWVGGAMGKGLTGLAGYGMKEAAVENIVRLGGKELLKKGVARETAAQLAARRALARTSAEKIIERGGHSALLSSYAPKAAGSIASAATLATFEGTRGGIQAAVNGEDVWDGIGRGVMHGGIMGGVIGAFGASLNVKNAALWNKAKKGVLTPKEELLKNFWITGKGGQVVGEAGIFTAPEIKNLIMDEDYKARDLFRSFFVNAGMMGVLKVQHHGQAKLWDKGRESIKEYWDGEGKSKTEIDEKIKDAAAEVAEESGVDVSVEETPTQRESKDDIAKGVDTFRENSRKIADVSKEHYKEWDRKFDEASEDIAKIDPKNKDGIEIPLRDKNGNLVLDKNGEPMTKLVKYQEGYIDVMPIEKWHNIRTQVQSVYGAMKKNIKRYKQDNPDINEAREAELKSKEDLANAWKEKIIDRYQDIEKVRRENEPIKPKDFKKGVDQAKSDLTKVWEEATEAEKKNIREGLEDKINEEGQITEQSAYKEIQGKIDAYLETKKKFEAPLPKAEPTKKESKKEEFERQFDEGEITDKLDDVKGEIDKIKSKDITKAGRLEKIHKVDRDIQEEVYGKTDVQKDAYNRSKKVLGYIAREFFMKEGLTGKDTALNHLRRLAKDLAKDGRSLFEITDKDIINFVQEGGASRDGRGGIKQAELISFIKGLKEIISATDSRPSELFNTRKFKLLTKEDIVKSIKELYKKQEAGGGEGLQNPGAETSSFEVGNNEIKLPTKSGGKTKYISTKLTNMLKDLIKRIIRLNKEKDIPEGHEQFLLRDIDGFALTTKEINILTQEIFGKKKFEDLKYGEARLFRNAVEQWAKKKITLKPTSKELKQLVEDNILDMRDVFEIVDKVIVGHGDIKSMKDLYSGTFDAPTLKRVVRAIIKEYANDIKTGAVKTRKSGKGYSTEEMAEGFKNLAIQDRFITFKDSKGNTRTVDKKTLEAMFQYMLESGPRLNEIAPSSETLGYSEKFASEKFQLESQERTAEAIISARELRDQAKYFKKKFPQLSVKILKTLGKHKGEYVLGKISGQLVKIAEGRARIDTLPHEVSHHVVDVLREMGDPFSKKLVKDGIKMFKKKGMSEAQAEEAFVESLGKYTAKELPKNMMGRMGSWVKRMWSHFKQYFGITNRRDVQQMQKDIVRIIGGKVLSGRIPTDIMPLKSRIKVKYQRAGTTTGDRAINKARKRVEEKEKLLIKDYEFTKEQLEEIGENIIGDKEYDKITVDDIERYEKRLDVLSDKFLEGKPKEVSLNEVKVEEIEIQYDISTEQRDAFFKDVFKTTIGKANNIMLDSYKAYIIKGNEIKPKSDTASDAVIDLTNGKDTNMPSISMWRRAFMTAGDILYHYGGKPGKIIANKLWAHDHTRSVLKGEGEVTVKRINDIVDKKTKNNYMHLLDKDLARGALEQVKELRDNFSKEHPKEKNPYDRELLEITDAIKNFSKGGDYYKARELWEGLSKFYWNTLIKEVSLNTKGNKEFQEIKKVLNEKFINQYFARKVTKEALMHLKKESPEIQRIINEEYKNLSREDIKRAEEEIGIKEKDPGFEDAVKSVLAEELMMMIDFGPTKVRPAFLKERGAQLPEYMEITLENGSKKMIKSYETSLDGTIGSYVNGMAKYLATVKHFTEYTDLRGKFTFGAEGKLQEIELMGAKKGEMGAYAAETIKRQLGLDYSNKDILMNPALNYAGKFTNWSAVAGLSSPMSGIKNVLIQIPRSVAIYGTRNTIRAIGYGLKARRDPKLFEKAMKEGQIGYGVKELIRKESRFIKWWFDNVNLMTKTENFNRIVLAEAGKMHFAELTNVARGTKSMFHPQGKKSEVIRMFKETWKLSDSDIKFIVEGKDIFETKRYHKILERVGFESHKAGAGATGVVDLPLWFSQKYIKPLTLFQRMATSVTIDSYKNYVKPLKNGNWAPILKATIGHGLSGVALFWMYDKFMGQQPPEEESPAIDRAVSYLWKGEYLGMFGEIISPYDKGMSVPIMEPIILRNARNAWSEISQVIGYGKGVDQALKDLTLNTIVLSNHAKRTFDNFNHPYSTEYKRVKTLRRTFNQAMGYEVSQGNFVSSRQPYYWKLKTAIMYGKSDADIALSYYNAFNYICSSLEEDGFTSKSYREKKARQAIEAVIRHMHPINLPDDKDNRRDSKRNEFLGYLSAENKALALKLEKEFKYKERQFYRIINRHKWKKQYSLYAYH